MFKVWIMHDVWFLNRRRVLKTPHPIFIFFYFSFKGNVAFCLYKFESPLKGCYKPSHLSLLFRWAKMVRGHNVYIWFFLIFSFCTIVYEHFKQYVVLGFVLELWQLNVQRVWVFILVGGGGVILIPKHCPRGNVWVLCRPSIDLKDKWRSFPKAFQNYTLRGFFLIRTRFAHFIHNCHDILRQFMIENMQL